MKSEVYLYSTLPDSEVLAAHLKPVQDIAGLVRRLQANRVRPAASPYSPKARKPSPTSAGRCFPVPSEAVPQTDKQGKKISTKGHEGPRRDTKKTKRIGLQSFSLSNPHLLSISCLRFSSYIE